MLISILGVGETKSDYLKRGEADYLRRLTHYCSVQSEWIRCIKAGNKHPSENRIHQEARQLMRKISDDDYIVILDINGEQLSSEAFAARISDWMLLSRKVVRFVIGGPDGIAPELLARADWVMSVSEMTFTHDMVRIFLLEQLYRAFTILRGEKYHK